MNWSALEVWLGNTLVGHIVRQDLFRCTFRLAESYLASPLRPILGQEFEDRYPHRVRTFHDAVPLWFTHLLPERGGFLRDVVVRQAGVESLDDFELLKQMGADLPGAVIVRVADAPVFHDNAQIDDPLQGQSEPAAAKAQAPISFALSGIQAKWSMSRDKDRGLRLTGNRSGEHWIVKTPDAVYQRACENEYVVMTWARLAGLIVPDIELIPTSRLRGLPPNVPLHQGDAFAIRRFDRALGNDGKPLRIHQEDFAQVMSRPVGSKYERASYDELGRLVQGLCGPEAFREYVHRLVFTIACGNADAHLKNWSVQYLDGRQVTLSPAYDLLAVVVYPELLARQELALPLNKAQSFRQVSMQSWQRMARLAGVGEGELVSEVKLAVDAALQAWTQLRATLLPDIDLPPLFAQRVEAHMADVPLLSQA